MSVETILALIGNLHHRTGLSNRFFKIPSGNPSLTASRCLADGMGLPTRAVTLISTTEIADPPRTPDNRWEVFVDLKVRAEMKKKHDHSGVSEAKIGIYCRMSPATVEALDRIRDSMTPKMSRAQLIDLACTEYLHFPTFHLLTA